MADIAEQGFPEAVDTLSMPILETFLINVPGVVNPGSVFLTLTQGTTVFTVAASDVVITPGAPDSQGNPTSDLSYDLYTTLPPGFIAGQPATLTASAYTAGTPPVAMPSVDEPRDILDISVSAPADSIQALYAGDYQQSLIALNPAVISYVETRTSQFSVNFPQVVIFQPDATQETNPPEIISTMSTDGLSATLTANYEPMIAGQYRFRYLFNDGQTQVIRTQRQFAFWTDVPTFVRTLLQMKPTRLADSIIEEQFALILAFVLARFDDANFYPNLQSYYGLRPADQEFFDKALAYMTAVQLYPQKMRGTSGLIDQVKVGNFQFNYQANGDDPRDNWTDQAVLCMGYLSDVRTYRKALAKTWNPNQANGPGRIQSQSGLAQGLLNTVLSVYQDTTDQSLL